MRVMQINLSLTLHTYN